MLAQQDGWFILTQGLGFIIFMIAALRGDSPSAAGTCRRPSMSSPPASLIEYSGMKFGMFFFVGEYVSVILASSLLTTLYFALARTDFGLSLFG